MTVPYIISVEQTDRIESGGGHVAEDMAVGEDVEVGEDMAFGEDVVEGEDMEV